MNRNQLKLLAILAMTADHIAMVFIQQGSLLYYLMRAFGRLTAPIMAFMLVEGFRHTHSRRSYFLRLSVFALVSQPFYFVLCFGRPPLNTLEFFTHWNVLFTFAVTLAALEILQSKLKTVQKIMLGSVLVSLASFGDWSYLIPAWAAVFYFFGNDFRKSALLFAAASVVLQTGIYLRHFDSLAAFSFQYSTIFALIPLRLYNGKSGHGSCKKRNRWFFYFYYPAHMAVLILLRLLH